MIDKFYEFLSIFELEFSDFAGRMSKQFANQRLENIAKSKSSLAKNIMKKLRARGFVLDNELIEILGEKKEGWPKRAFYFSNTQVIIKFGNTQIGRFSGKEVRNFYDNHDIQYISNNSYKDS
jgi:hypothetical protein